VRRPRSIVVLIIWFIWSAGQDLDNIVRHAMKADYYVFSSNGMESVFFFLVFAIFLLNASAIYYLFKPDKWGLYTAFGALLLAAFENAVALSLAIRDLPGVREAYERGREIRGLPVREEAMNMLFTEESMYYAAGIMLIAYFLMSFLVFRNVRYFREGCA